MPYDGDLDENERKLLKREENIHDHGYTITRTKLKKLDLHKIKFNYDVPIYTHDKGKSTILVIMDSVQFDPGYGKKFQSESYQKSILVPGITGGIFSNVLAFLENQNTIAKKIICIPLPAFKLSCDQLLDQCLPKFKPDVVLLLGPKLLEPYLPKKARDANVAPGFFRGRLLPLNNNVQVVSTFSWPHLASLDFKCYSTTANLLGYFLRDMETAIRGTNLYTLPPVPREMVVLIKTMKQWKQVFAKMITKKVISIDTEDENLNRVYKNRLLTAQFYFGGKFAYVLPIYHFETPFTGKEIEIILEDLRTLFTKCEQRFLIFQNAKFDLHQFKRDLKLRFIKSPVYDIATGEFALDENRKFMADARIFPNKNKDVFALGTFAYQYGGLAYLDGDIAKSDRSRMAEIPLEKIALYGITDVVYPFHIAKFQLAEAERRGSAYDGFEKAVACLGSDMTHVFVDMEHNGSLIDFKYVQNMMMLNSDFHKLLKKRADKFREFKSARKANQELNDKTGKSSDGLFGKIEPSWLFDPAKAEHLQLLFYKILALKAITQGKNDTGKLDKLFIAEYAETVPEVKALSDLRQMKVLMNTYIKGFYKLLMESADCSDHRLRAQYGFIFILTWRSSAAKPSLQNVPSHGENAKIIKREFIAAFNKLLVKADYNAHEVRGWGNISNDKNIGQAFKPGMELRRQLRLLLNGDPELHEVLIEKLAECNWFKLGEDVAAKEKIIRKAGNLGTTLQLLLDIESRGDVHRSNYELFFGVPAIKVNKVQRQSVKAIVFGTLFGKGARNLAKAIYAKELRACMKEFGEDSDEYQTLYKEKCHESQNIIDKMFGIFKDGKQWIDGIHIQGKQTLVNTSVFKWVRHLTGYLHTDQEFISMMNRRGPNSMIQGPSSNIIFTSMRLMQIINYDLLENDVDIGWMHNNVVHDSSENENDICMLPLSLYYMEHALTTQVYKKCRDTYDWDMPIQLEIDIEIGGTHSQMTSWDFTKASLLRIVENSMRWQMNNLGYEYKLKKTLQAVSENFDLVWPYREKELQKLRGFKPSDEMLLTPEKAAKLSWKKVTYETNS